MDEYTIKLGDFIKWRINLMVAFRKHRYSIQNEEIKKVRHKEIYLGGKQMFTVIGYAVLIDLKNKRTLRYDSVFIKDEKAPFEKTDLYEIYEQFRRISP